MSETTVQGLRGNNADLKYTAHSSVVIALVPAETEVDLRPPRSAAGYIHPGQLARAQGARHLAAWQDFRRLKSVDELRLPMEKDRSC